MCSGLVYCFIDMHYRTHTAASIFLQLACINDDAYFEAICIRQYTSKYMFTYHKIAVNIVTQCKVCTELLFFPTH